MPTKKMNYEELSPYIPQNGNEENYALLTHFLMMRDGNQKEEKRNDLIQHFGFEEDKLHLAENFYNRKEIPFVAQQNANFTFIDLFAGIGGFRLAMQNCGGKCVFSSEWDKAAKETYYDNYGEVPFGDITKQTIKALIPEQFNVLCAGFPCQPFSNAGLKRGIEDVRGTLFYEIAEILQEHQPEVVLLENVRGLISNDNGRTLQTILQTITHLGYKCNIPQEYIDNGPIIRIKKEASRMVLSAKDYGVPQNRPRIYIVLWRENLNVETFNYPEPTYEETLVNDILEQNVPATFTISDRLWEGHQRRRMNNAAHGKGFGYCSFTPDSPYTSTISRRYYKDGSEILIEQEGMNPRKLTPREATNLQGFPREFRIHHSNVEAYKQAGNSVAVPVVEHLANEILNQFFGE
ncbi:MAG: DNA (cytosine-5-)-methyltransferase [Treponema sp.]|nr:DNA (cytosine-5-)-methyltransferase [Treponema sp.]